MSLQVAGEVLIILSLSNVNDLAVFRPIIENSYR